VSGPAAPSQPGATPRGRLLVADDERSVRDILSIYLQREGYDVTLAADGREALAALDVATFDVVLTDLQMPGADGLMVLERVKASAPQTQVILLTAYATTETAISAMKAGAYDYLAKPFKPQEIGALCEKACEKRALLMENLELRDALRGPNRFGDLIGKSQAMRETFALVDKVADARTTVLVSGESGTGKELIARALHQRSRRRAGPFVAVNCGAIPAELLESELFGHRKGAFTGATADRRGLFEQASGGTLFLDEVGDLPAPLQVKLLRALQERTVRPVGANVEIAVDARVVAASNRNLREEVEKGDFRSDLFYRLNVVQVHLPPLRHRPEDVPILLDHFLAHFARELGRPAPALSHEALQALMRYPWPGNVRELENAVERAVTLAEREVVGVAELPEPLRAASGPLASATSVDLPEKGLNLDQVLGEIERTLILRALARTSGVRKAAAGLLGVTFRSIRYRMQKLGLAGGGDDDEEGPEAAGGHGSGANSGTGPTGGGRASSGGASSSGSGGGGAGGEGGGGASSSDAG
jgi:two-component system response regulator PilR (NtrC family)